MKGATQQEEVFEEIFKSESGGHECPECGAGLLISKSETGVIVKSRKKKRGSADIGNQMEPHKGGRTGSFVAKKRPNTTGGGAVQRRATQPSNPTVEKSMEEDEGAERPVFPFRKSFSLAEYGPAGSGPTDAEIAKSMVENGAGGAIAPQRNFLIEKGGTPPKDETESDSASSDEETEVTPDEESSEE